MGWYNYLAIFFSGVFLSNSIPHFVKGVSGDKFPTPFARPPGKGLSSPILNVLWGGVNIVVGVALFSAGKLPGDVWDTLIFFTGFMLMGVISASGFSKKHKE